MIDDLADAPAHQPFALRERHDVVVNKQAALLAAASLLPTPPPPPSRRPNIRTIGRDTPRDNRF